MKTPNNPSSCDVKETTRGVNYVLRWPWSVALGQLVGRGLSGIELSSLIVSDALGKRCEFLSACLSAKLYQPLERPYLGG